MKLIFNFIASLLFISIITASSSHPSPTKHLSYIKNINSVRHGDKCAICRDILFKPLWTPEEIYEHGNFLIKKITANKVYGLHLLCLARYRDCRHLVGHWSETNESQFKELIKGSFNHIISGFIKNQVSGPWIQYVELCSLVQEQDVMGIIGPLCNPENLPRLKEFLEVLIVEGVPQSTPIIRILMSLTAANTEPVPANLNEGNPECSTAQASKNSDGGPQHRKREAHRASPYPPTSARDRIHPTGDQPSQPIDSGIPAHGAVQNQPLNLLPTHSVISVRLSNFPAVPVGQLSQLGEPQGAAQIGCDIFYNNLISLKFVKTSTPEMLRSIMSFVFKSAKYSFGQKYDLLIFVLDYQSQFENVKITEAVLVDLVKDYTDLYNGILLHFAFNDYRAYKMKFSPPTVVRVVDHYVASPSFNSILLIDLISILTESVDREGEEFKQLEGLFNPQKYRTARPSSHELSGDTFSTLLLCYKSTSIVHDLRKGRKRILKRLILHTQEHILSYRVGEVLHLIYLMNFVSSNTRATMLSCLSHILEVADAEYRVTLYELFMPKDFQDDVKFLQELMKTDSNSAVKRFLKILAGRKYFPSSSFMLIIFHLKNSQHSNLTFYFARLVARHCGWLEDEFGQGRKSMPQYRLKLLMEMQEYYTALCLERYFCRFPEYVGWVTENMAKIIETTPSDQWVLRMSYLSNSQCEPVVNAYYQQTSLIVSKCREHVAEVQAQEYFLSDLLNETRLRNTSGAVF